MCPVEIPQRPVVGIVGATGAVGVELIRCLEQRDFPLSDLRLFASPRSAGRRMAFRGREIAVEPLEAGRLAGIDLGLFSAGSGVAKEFAPLIARAGGVVVDNSSAFRMEDAVPLVVPEINPQAMAGRPGIIANPNCAAIIALMALWPVHRRNPLRRVMLATYQAASGAGAAAMAELEAATRAALDGRPFQPRVLPHPYAFNLFSHNTAIDPATGYNGEETKVMNEARKILGAPDLRISATCIRVPVLRAHAVALQAECERPVEPEAIRDWLESAPGIRVVDDRAANHFPMPIEASGRDEVLVGRIRADLSDPSGCSVALLAAGDQLRKGAALNAVQIAERVVSSRRP